MYADPPLRYRPRPISAIVKWANAKGARRKFAQCLAEDPRAAMEEANIKLGEASRQEEERQNILEGSL